MESERINFKKWRSEDLKLAIELWGDERVSKFVSAKGYFTEDEIKHRLETEISNEQKYGIQYWPMYLKETGEFIGCCGLRPYDIESKIYETGIYLLPKFWGQGFASEAMKRVIQYGMNELKAENIFVGHNPKNISSKKMIERLEFHYIKDEFYEPTGLMHPLYSYKKIS